MKKLNRLLVTHQFSFLAFAQTFKITRLLAKNWT